MKADMDTGDRRVVSSVGFAVLVAFVLVLVNSCSISGAPVENGPKELTEQLMSIWESGEEERLHDLVPGDWDVVHIFEMEALDGDRVDEEVGFDVAIPGDEYFLSDGVVIVFANERAVVRAAAIYGVRFGVVYTTGGADSVVGRTDDGDYLELR